ncbi:hypothetical protein [Thiohalophilus sp.]|uniref:hypothetical protein n=1 Tax=Thiohalophilus sp. TaxID=3028392 RepID=UPI002ACF02A9|nr:hypothetical protein [Thiohalophilus sp.]MDZ7802376.1 hypothetical protein [Thiohalophilus sp.]
MKVSRADSINGIYQARITHKATGKRNNFRLQALSDETSGKGLLFMNLRPQGALVDDLETTKETLNPANGKKKLDFVLQELYGAITGPLVWLGNMGRKTSALHQGFEHIYENEEELKEFKTKGSPPGLFAKACAKNGGKLNTKDGLELMRGFIFKAEYPDGSKLWPERFGSKWYASKTPHPWDTAMRESTTETRSHPARSSRTSRAIREKISTAPWKKTDWWFSAGLIPPGDGAKTVPTNAGRWWLTMATSFSYWMDTAGREPLSVKRSTGGIKPLTSGHPTD